MAKTTPPATDATPADTALTTVNLQEMIVAERPAGVDEVTGAEGIGRDDIIIPRIGLAQKMSREIDPTSPHYIDGLKFMDLFNSLSKKVYGRGPLHFVILRRDAPRWMELIPLDQGGGIKDRNVPAGDPRTEWHGNDKPIATMFYDYLVLVLTDLNPADYIGNVMAISLKSSAIKEAKSLNMFITQRGKKLICKGVYELRTGNDTDKKSGGVYATYKFNNAGWLKEGSSLEALAIEMYESWKDRDVKIDEDMTDFDPEKLEPEHAAAASEM